MISILIVFPFLTLDYAGCYGEYNQSSSVNTIDLICEHKEETKHNYFFISKGPITGQVNNTILRQCSWKLINSIHDGQNDFQQLVIHCPEEKK